MPARSRRIWTLRPRACNQVRAPCESSTRRYTASGSTCSARCSNGPASTHRWWSRRRPSPTPTSRLRRSRTRKSRACSISRSTWRGVIGPTSCSRTIPMRTASRWRSPRPETGGSSPATRPAPCSAHTCSRRARATTASSPAPWCRRDCSTGSQPRPACPLAPPSPVSSGYREPATPTGAGSCSGTRRHSGTR